MQLKRRNFLWSSEMLTMPVNLRSSTNGDPLSHNLQQHRSGITASINVDDSARMPTKYEARKSRGHDFNVVWQDATGYLPLESSAVAIALELCTKLWVVHLIDDSLDLNHEES